MGILRLTWVVWDVEFEQEMSSISIRNTPFFVACERRRISGFQVTAGNTSAFARHVFRGMKKFLLHKRYGEEILGIFLSIPETTTCIPLERLDTSPPNSPPPKLTVPFVPRGPQGRTHPTPSRQVLYSSTHPGKDQIQDTRHFVFRRAGAAIE